MFVKRFAVKKRLFYALKAKKILVRQSGAPPHKTAATARVAYLLTTAAYRYAEAASLKRSLKLADRPCMNVSAAYQRKKFAGG